ncbi:hypothetical protein ABZZ17_04000 [Streptomyces sp. NPDC006512]|uniref:hypothetical protein n=1 Tax=Streptomyces sp. NPDC006512 TaxID=3154307 RepID=UPI0033A04D77
MSVSHRTHRLLTTAAVALLLGAGLVAPATAHTVTTAAPSASASLRAPGFNAGGVWDIYQTNATVRVNLSQDGGGNLYGTVSSGSTVGTLDGGAVNGNDIHFTVRWSHGPVGRYTGTRGADGRLSGLTVDLTNPGSQATWYTRRTF